MQFSLGMPKDLMNGFTLPYIIIVLVVLSIYSITTTIAIFLLRRRIQKLHTKYKSWQCTESRCQQSYNSTVAEWENLCDPYSVTEITLPHAEQKEDLDKIASHHYEIICEDTQKLLKGTEDVDGYDRLLSDAHSLKDQNGNIPVVSRRNERSEGRNKGIQCNLYEEKLRASMTPHHYEIIAERNSIDTYETFISCSNGHLIELRNKKEEGSNEGQKNRESDDTYQTFVCTKKSVVSPSKFELSKPFGSSDHLKFFIENSVHTSIINDGDYLVARSFIPKRNCPESLRQLGTNETGKRMSKPPLPPRRRNCSSETSADSVF